MAIHISDGLSRQINILFIINNYVSAIQYALMGSKAVSLMCMISVIRWRNFRGLDNQLNNAGFTLNIRETFAGCEQI